MVGVIDISLVDLRAQILDEAHNVAADRKYLDAADLEAVRAERVDDYLFKVDSRSLKICIESAGLLNVLEDAGKGIVDRGHSEVMDIAGAIGLEEGVAVLKGLGISLRRTVGEVDNKGLILVDFVGLRVADYLAVLSVVKSDGSELVREARNGCGLDIIESLAVVADMGGDIGGMEMSAEGEVHTRVCESLGALHPIVKHESKEYFGLDGHVGNEVVVSHADDSLAIFLRLFALLEHPLHELGGDAARGLLNIVALGGDIGRILVGIHDDESVAALEAYSVGELTRLTCGGGEDIFFFVRHKVASEILIDLAERLGRGDFTGLFDAVFECNAVIVVDIVVAVYNDDLYSALLFKGFELCGKSLVACKLAIEGQIAGQEHIVALLLSGLVESRCQERVNLVELTGAFIVPFVVGFAESVFRVSGSFFGISKIVDVGDGCDFELALFGLRKGTENSGREGGKDEGHADYNCNDASCQSSFVFHFVSSFFGFILNKNENA